MTNNDIFQEFWQNHQWQQAKPVSYRLYHDTQGRVIEYSMEEREHDWIEITVDQYALADVRARVVNGVLTLPAPESPPKMRPGSIGTACHPWSVLVVVDPKQPHQAWSRHTDAH